MGHDDRVTAFSTFGAAFQNYVNWRGKNQHAERFWMLQAQIGGNLKGGNLLDTLEAVRRASMSQIIDAMLASFTDAAADRDEAEVLLADLRRDPTISGPNVTRQDIHKWWAAGKGVTLDTMLEDVRQAGTLQLLAEYCPLMLLMMPRKLMNQ